MLHNIQHDERESLRHCVFVPNVIICPSKFIRILCKKKTLSIYKDGFKYSVISDDCLLSDYGDCSSDRPE